MNDRYRFRLITALLPNVSYNDLFGNPARVISLSPGTLTGQHSSYTLLAPGTPAYNPTGIFLPSFGFTYSPNFASSGLLKKLIGESGAERPARRFLNGFGSRRHWRFHGSYRSKSRRHADRQLAI